MTQLMESWKRWPPALKSWVVWMFDNHAFCYVWVYANGILSRPQRHKSTNDQCVLGLLLAPAVSWLVRHGEYMALGIRLPKRWCYKCPHPSGLFLFLCLKRLLFSKRRRFASQSGCNIQASGRLHVLPSDPLGTRNPVAGEYTIEIPKFTSSSDRSLLSLFRSWRWLTASDDGSCGVSTGGSLDVVGFE